MQMHIANCLFQTNVVAITHKSRKSAFFATENATMYIVLFSPLLMSTTMYVFDSVSFFLKTRFYCSNFFRIFTIILLSLHNFFLLRDQNIIKYTRTVFYLLRLVL